MKANPRVLRVRIGVLCMGWRLEGYIDEDLGDSKASRRTENMLPKAIWQLFVNLNAICRISPHFAGC